MIISLDNKRIKELAKLQKKKQRNKDNMFLVEGFHLVEEAKKAELLLEVFTSDESINGTLVSKDVIKKLSDSVTPQSVVGLVKKPELKPLGDKVLALNNIQDPGNLGTLIRSATAFGFSDVLIQGVDQYNPKVVRSSQGAIFKINIVQTNDITKHFEDYETIGAVLDKNATIYNEFKPLNKFMIILGNESNGIEQSVMDKLDKKIYIPIEFESLNVASAGAILLNEYK